MSMDYQTEYEANKQQRKELARKCKSIGQFVLQARDLFETQEQAEDYWEAYLTWGAEQDNISGGN